MFKLTYLQVSHPAFQQAVQAIWDCPLLDGRTSFTAYRIKTEIDKAEDEVKKLRIGLIDKYAVKDAEGKVVQDERGNITFDPPEKVKEFHDEFTREFSTREVTVRALKLDFNALAQVQGLTPRSWEYLEPLVDNLPLDEIAEAMENDAPLVPENAEGRV